MNAQNHITPRGLSREQAATYVGIGTTFFDKQIALGVYPEPVRVGVRKLWDRVQLDSALDRLFAGDAAGEEEIVLQ
jgi:predicted DNA-binding transcriptional regulator AlpA